MIYEPQIECSDREILEALQALRLRRMISQYIGHIPPYRERLEDVFGSSVVDKLSKLSDSELLSGISKIKPVFRDEYQSINRMLLKALDRRLFYIDSSSGSTGSPKSRFCSVEDDLHDTALSTRALASFGVSCIDRVLTFDLADLTYYTQFTKAMQDLGVKNSYYYCARSDFETSLREAMRWKPTTIITMPSILKRCFNAFVDCCKQTSNVKRLIYFGEPLENDIRKYLLEQHAIECFSLYGSTDVGWLAAECDAHDGMHLFADSVLLHLFSETNSTELLEDGTALFTSLFQTGKPNLRYSNGDKLRLNRHACSCGRTTPKVYVSCRDTDIFALLGMKISIKEIQHVIYESEEVSCYFQVELTQSEEKTLFIVRLPGHLEIAAERITEGLENRIGLAFYTCLDLVKIRLDYVANDYFTTRKIPTLIDNRGSFS